MALVKQGIDVSFAKGLDTKTDPKRVAIGNFVQLENSVFNKGGLLQKRNGYQRLASLADTSSSYLTTFNGNLTAVGENISAYNSGAMSWVSRGSICPMSLDTLPVIRNNLNQTACDIAIADSGAGCAVYLESNGSSTTNKYVIFDSVTGQNLSAPVAIPVASGTVSGGMRVFVLGQNFIIVFTNTITGTAHLQFIAISIQNPSIVTANADIASSYITAATVSWDGYVYGSRLFIAYNTTSGGQAVKVTYLTQGLVVATAATFATYKSTMMSVTVDSTNVGNPDVWLNFYDSISGNGFAIAVDQNLNTVVTPQATMIAYANVKNIASAAINGVCYQYYEFGQAYLYDAAIPTNAILYFTIDKTPTVAGQFASIYSLGLASKAFIVDGTIYYLGVYQSPYQNTYFLVNGTDSSNTSPVVVAKLAYGNGGGYLPTGLPSVSVSEQTVRVGYLFKDLIQAVNKNTNVPSGSQTAGIYSQTGINLATFAFGTDAFDTAEIGSNLNLSGGFLGMYDGYLPVEQSFFLYPDSIEATWSATGGAIHAQPDGATNASAYYYQVTYEWTDNQGNAFRSSPSIPIAVTTTGSGTAGSITLHIPTLRVTMKSANPVKIVIYRWSVAQQNYYQVTSISSPKLNDLTVDAVSYVDTLADSSTLGNNLIYTTGGVIEDISAPSTDIMALFDTRLWLVSSEDRNLLWFSKQVIEATPVEMSDLLTMFVPPTVGNATGDMTALAPMDDKLIISKGGNSFVYINGTGPDNTGANNQYSQPIFITSTVGCDNQKSICFTPNGMMFQSNKGIWLLGRDLSTSYIGAPAEDFVTGARVTSAVTIPETNQVRFTLSTGITLMYDYYYDQWAVFTGIAPISSCIYQDLHTFINEQGHAYQENPGSYLDGSSPVLMKFQTGPIRMGELQNYQRVYYFYLLGTYLSPHKLNVSMLFDYERSPSQSVLISPTNYSPPFGAGDSQTPSGQGDPFGGPNSLEPWRVFLDRQRCMAFAIRVEEIFDPTLGAAAGAGLTLSGLNVIAAFKKPFRPQPAQASTG